MKNRISIIPFVLLILIYGCQKEPKVDQNEDNGGQKMEQAVTIDSLAVVDAWIRPATKGSNSGLFFEIINGTESPDTIYSAKSDLAAIVEVHESYQETDGRMGMRQVENIEIPSKTKFMFKPRSFHVMLIILKNDLKLDETYEVSLFFKHKGEVKVKAVVQDRMQQGMKGH